MFGHNQVVTARDFSDQVAGTLKVTSVFFTLQGEGPFSGQPCVFVRLAGCHLTCRFCDTYFDRGDVLSFFDIVRAAGNAVERFDSSSGCDLPDLFVITGGEPCLQPQLVPFIEHLHSIFSIHTQVETTGTVDISNQLDDVRPYIVCSPKINLRGDPLRIAPGMLDLIDCMKCIVSATDPLYSGIPEVVLRWRDRHPDRSVYVSPMNVYLKQPIKLGPDSALEGRSEADERVSFWTEGLLDRRANQQNHEYAAELALRHRVRLSLQTHLYASLP